MSEPVIYVRIFRMVIVGLVLVQQSLTPRGNLFCTVRFRRCLLIDLDKLLSESAISHPHLGQD